MADKFEGVVIKNGEIRYGKEGGPIAGARASVETAGDIERRITATRLVLTGPFALAFRKKKDHRELYLTVEGPGYGFVVQVDPKKSADARQFAARVNALAGSAGPPAASAPIAPAPGPSVPPAPPGTPAGWQPDPAGRHEHRYWDGGRWTEHVSDGGTQSVDAL
jgi:hypothetical protein